MVSKKRHFNFKKWILVALLVGWTGFFFSSVSPYSGSDQLSLNFAVVIIGLILGVISLFLILQIIFEFFYGTRMATKIAFEICFLLAQFLVLRTQSMISLSFVVMIGLINLFVFWYIFKIWR